MHDEHLGYITTCLTNLGTGMTFSLTLNLPCYYKKQKIDKNEQETLKKFNYDFVKMNKNTSMNSKLKLMLGDKIANQKRMSRLGADTDPRLYFKNKKMSLEEQEEIKREKERRKSIAIGYIEVDFMACYKFITDKYKMNLTPLRQDKDIGRLKRGEDSLVEISNKRKLGITETQTIVDIITCAKELI